MSVGRSSGEAVAGPDPSWRGLYRAGAISAVLYVVLNIGALVLLIITPPVPSSGGATTLQYIASNKSVYLLELVLFVAPMRLRHGGLPGSLHDAQAPEQELRRNSRLSRYRLPGCRPGLQRQPPVAQRRPDIPE